MLYISVNKTKSDFCVFGKTADRNLLKKGRITAVIIQAKQSEISRAIDYIRDTLKERKVKSSDIVKAALSAEEFLRVIIEHAAGAEETVSVSVRSFLGSVDIHMNCRGSAFALADVGNAAHFDLGGEADPESERVIRNLMSRILNSENSVTNRGGVNTVTIRAVKSKYRQLYLTFGALLAGIGVGLLMKALLPDAINSAISANLFTPVSTMFLNALKMVVAPLVLCSIASSLADFSDMSALGRIALKVIGSYFVTSIIAIAIGAAVWFAFPIGNPALQEAVTDAAASTIAKGEGVSTSVIDTVVGIVPSDVITPFLKADMLQIIFIAAMVGLATGALAKKLHSFKFFLSDCNLVFSKITAMIIGVMPLAIFCSMAKMILSMKLQTLASALAWVPTIYFADGIMIAAYALLILLVGRMNPLNFFKKFYPAMLTAFTLASSNAVLPTSMELCDRSLGISKRIYSFSLPLGATINMDGSCITQMISALFMAKIFGIPVTGSVLLTLALTIFVLSVGAPGVPGGALVCISLLVPQIGIPAEAISIIMGLYSIVGMMQTCVNVTGDAAVTLIAARSEDLLDMKVYNE